MGGSFLIHSLQCCRARRLREAHTNFTLLFPTASGKAISAPKQSQLVVSSGAQRVLSGAAGEAELWALRKPKRPIILSDAKNQTPPPSQPMGACPCARHLRPALNRALCPPTFSPYNIDKKKKKKLYTRLSRCFLAVPAPNGLASTALCRDLDTERTVGALAIGVPPSMSPRTPPPAERLVAGAALLDCADSGIEVLGSPGPPAWPLQSYLTSVPLLRPAANLLSQPPDPTSLQSFV